MKLTVLCTIASAIVGVILASPFEAADEYIKKYETDMEEMIKEAKEYQSKEFSFEKLFKDKEVHKNPHEYDFIIVGGGTSGAVLAARLTEVPEHNVLLVDAGFPETPISKIPAMHPYVAKLNHWGYKTIPQKNWCQEEASHQCHVPTSKMIGGTTSLNEMLYNRGNKRDFDTWADEENKDWCFNDVLPYFKKSEDAHLHDFDRKFHQQGGALSVEDNDLDLSNNLTKKFIAAGEELKMPLIDYNGKEQLGVSSLQLMTLHGERRSSFGAFIEKSRRKNLFVLRGNIVVQILISPHTKEAQGIKYIDLQGNVKTAKANKEVIISAGAINTARLLMNSGVGPKDHLKEHEIDAIVDLPVGQHLKDHPTVDLEFYFPDKEEHKEEHKEEKVEKEEKEEKEEKKEEKHTKCDNPKHQAQNNLLKYLKDSHGPLTQPEMKAIAHIKTASSTQHPKYPDVQLVLRQELYNEHVKISVTLNHPESKGTVKLASNDLLKHPLIDLNFYSDEDDRDLNTMKEGLKVAREIAHKMGLKEVKTVCHTDNVKSDSEDEDECIIKHRTRSAGDLTGTAIMGSDEHKSVVNDKLQVNGVHKLRVVDLAVVPVSITGDVRATGIMIAEKAGDLIKHSWK